MAYSVARTKTYIDSIGKELVSHYKEAPKKIDSVRKFARDSLDYLRDEVRKPLDEWENEQARLKLLEEIAIAHEDALLMNGTYDEIKSIRLAMEETARKLREEEIRAKAIAEAELKIKIEREELERKHAQQLEQAEQKRLLAIERAEIEKAEAINAERRRAEQQQQIIDHKKRIDEESKIKAERKKEEERIAIENDINHRELIQKKIINDLMHHSETSKENAKKIFNAIGLGLITNLSINYQ
jgi:hypothetical protein